jgi:hypothetical protein
MDLLQATGEVVNGMDDVQKDRMNVVDKHIDTCQADAKEEQLAAKHSRVGIRKQLQEEMKDLTELMNKRVDIVKTDLKEFQKENATEIKVLNDQITAIKTDTSEIKGMVQILMNKSQN